MKKLIALLLAAVMLLGLTACGAPAAKETNPPEAPKTEEPKVEETKAPETPEDPGELVIYTPVDQEEIDVFITSFEEKTGIKVEVVTAGTGELLKRVEAESENPLGDVMFGGQVSVALPYKEYFEPYVGANDDAMIDSCKNVEGVLTPNSILPMCLVVNTNLIGDLEINGYEDLLNPELKGKIAFVDPAQSSTGVQHLVAMLQAMGGDDEAKGWEYVTKLIENLDGKLLSSSSAIGKGVADGEYVVGLTHEGYVDDLISDGYPVKAVYQEEGLLVSPGCAEIIKGCKNLENAKKFIDHIGSFEVQSAAAEKLGSRSARKDVAAPGNLADVNGMNVMIEDVYNTTDNTQRWLETFKDIYTG